ncbi:MAG: hypothetical protein JW893_01870 [Candidatus Omnitrophica bacterium]|nr:hypothetical protein [Candidatus Omnitrophota bacterium]
MDPKRRLKRGLKDISPLFQQKVETVERQNLLNEKRIECLSVFNPDRPGSSLFLTSYLASRVADTSCPCTIISLTSRYLGRPEDAPTILQSESFGSNIRWVSFTWDQLERVWEYPHDVVSSESFANQKFFLDFEYNRIAQFDKIIPVLDKWILLVRPNIESLSEVYKAMKASMALNPHLEYYLLFDGAVTQEKGSFLYEKFSEMTSRHLGLSVTWLGRLQEGMHQYTFSSSLALEHLSSKPVENYNSLEKRMLARLLQTSLEFAPCHNP